MADHFTGEIRIFAFNFAPQGWAVCDGTGTPATPDFQGRAPMHPGQGSGLSLRNFGESGGCEAVVLLESEMPSHSHGVNCVAAAANQKSPSVAGVGQVIAAPAGQRGQHFYSNDSTNKIAMHANSIAPGGGNQAHNNMPPYLTLHFCIAS